MISTGGLSNLMGNSVVGENYFCAEGELSGDKCIIYSKPYIVGNINIAEVINSKDLNELAIVLNNVQNSKDDYPLYNINGDGVINTIDYQAMNEVLQSTGVATSGSNLNIESSNTVEVSSENVFNETVIGQYVCESGYSLVWEGMSAVCKKTLQYTCPSGYYLQIGINGVAKCYKPKKMNEACLDGGEYTSTACIKNPSNNCNGGTISSGYCRKKTQYKVK